MTRYIDFADAPDKASPVKSPAEDFDIDDNESAEEFDFEAERKRVQEYEHIVETRSKELQKLTSEFILKLVNEVDKIEDLGLESVDVEAILDVIEEELFNYGVYIDRPVISETQAGLELMPSMYHSEEDFNA